MLSIAWGIEPKQMHATWVTENGGSSLSQSIFDSLVKMDSQENVYPDLAEKWEVTPDAKTWTFHLAKNVKWHDGKPFSSADVKYTIETVIKIKGPGANGPRPFWQVTGATDLLPAGIKVGMAAEFGCEVRAFNTLIGKTEDRGWNVGAFVSEYDIVCLSFSGGRQCPATDQTDAILQPLNRLQFAAV